MRPPRPPHTMAHLPGLPVLLFVFLGVHVPASHGTPLPPSTYDASICSESFWCGGVEIRYPFYLSSAIREIADSTYYSCGYTDLEISCLGQEPTAGTPIIRLGSDDYTVQNIFYHNQTIVLADKDVLDGENDCPVVLHNVTFDDVWLHNTSSYENLTFFFGCYSDPGDTVPPVLDTDKYQINCRGFGNLPGVGDGISFVFAPEELNRSQEPELARNCKKIVTVPVRSEILIGKNQSMLARGGYGAVLKQGFELSWSQITVDSCDPCQQSRGRCAYTQRRAFLGCLCSDGKVGKQDCNNSSASSTASPSRYKGKTKMYIVAITSCLLLLCLLIIAFFLARKYSLLSIKSKKEPRMESFLQKNGNLHPKRYTYAELKRMTKSFAVKLGQGGFGAVYRGNFSDGRQVAVKMLKASRSDGEEFMNEAASISRTSHVNIVTLLGFCLQGSKRALIYEYMPNGSLEKYAFNSNLKSENTLTWEKLFDIAIGIARGLEYLHRGCNTRIVHFDIKPHNILLDQDFCPKISDFGLAKLCLNKESIISIDGARGTIGYIAPEVYSKQFGTISSKSDVYSYGMMVLEMVGARDTNVNANNESSSQYFPQWIYEHLDEYCISASEINGEITELLRKMIVVGLWCIQVIPSDRPTMTRVVEMLEGSTSSLELPQNVLLS